MQDIFQVTRNMNKLAHVVVVKLKLLQRKQMFDISQVTCNEIVHPNHMISFFQESLTQMTSQKAGGACY
jgi:hypothetical protein